jgi:uncharacterized protein (DUF1800 family)
MELFTLGEGNYTELDVKEASRSLTGWTFDRNGFQFVEPFHDAGEKCILGRTGKYGGDDLLDILLDHPATARRLAWRLCDTFLGDGLITEKALSELAEGLRQHNLNIGWAVDTILRSELFFSEENISTRVLGPVDYVVGSVQLLEMLDSPPSTGRTAFQARPRFVLSTECIRLGRRTRLDQHRILHQPWWIRRSISNWPLAAPLRTVSWR